MIISIYLSPKMRISKNIQRLERKMFDNMSSLKEACLKSSADANTNRMNHKKFCWAKMDKWKQMSNQAKELAIVEALWNDESYIYLNIYCKYISKYFPHISHNEKKENLQINILTTKFKCKKVKPQTGL